MMDQNTIGLIAVGASVAANCQSCLEYHVGKALEMGIDRDEIGRAIEVAQSIRKGAANSMDKHAGHLIQKRFTLSSSTSEPCSCC